MSRATSPILALNAGSSSLKFSLHHPEAPHDPIAAGQTTGDGEPQAQLDKALLALPPAVLAQVAAVGHRIVHGGPAHTRHALITPPLLSGLRDAAHFAPLHVPQQLALIEACHRRLPHCAQVACLDTAFHRDLPPVAQRLPLPRRFHDHGVRRYGFHGLAFASVREQLVAAAEPAMHRGRAIFAHLGGGASLAALRHGQPIDTSMGFTPTGGLVMSTRSGDLDPGALIFLMEQGALTPAALRALTARESGLLAISETSGDMRTLLATEARDPRAAEAVALFCYQTRKWIGAFAAALEGLDLLVFSGGVGEHAAAIRLRICAALTHLGVGLDPARNERHEAVISSAGTPVTVRIAVVDEQRQIARITAALTATTPTP